MLALAPPAATLDHKSAARGGEHQVCNITVGRYDDPESVGYAGWVEPSDRSWIAFVRNDGSAQFYLDRDPETGAVR